MSGAVTAVVFLPALAGVGMSLVAAYGTYLLVRGAARGIAATCDHINSEYHAARAAYEQRENERLAILRERSEMLSAELELSRQLGELGRLASREDSDRAMLEAGIKRIQERLNSGAAVSAELREQLEQLISSSAITETAPLLARYQALSRRLALEQAPAPRLISAPGALAPAEQAELASQLGFHLSDLRERVGADALLDSQAPGLKAELIEQLSKLERLRTSQPRLVSTSLEALEQRYAEIQESLRLQKEALEEAEARRPSMLARIFATIEVLGGPDMDDPQTARAVRELRRKVASAEQLAGRAQLDAFGALVASSEEIYASWLLRQEARLQRTIIEDQMRDVLTEMGYQVQMAEPGAPMLFSLDPNVGLEVSLEEGGNLHCEMVAFGEEAREAAAAREEHVCQVADEMYARLRARNLQVRERTRRRLRGPGELKLAERPVSGTAPLAESSKAPRYLDETDK